MVTLNIQKVNLKIQFLMQILYNKILIILKI